MTKQEAYAAIRAGRLPATPDWYGGFLAVFYCVCLLAVSTVLVFIKTTESSFRAGLLFFPATAVFSYYTFHALLTERKLISVGTSFSASENRKIVLAAFQSLGWNVVQSSPHVILASIGTGWIGIPVHATALLTNGVIHLNLMNGGGNNKGRIPFSFGKNDEKLRRLIDEINVSKH